MLPKHQPNAAIEYITVFKYPYEYLYEFLNSFKFSFHLNFEMLWKNFMGQNFKNVQGCGPRVPALRACSISSVALALSNYSMHTGPITGGI